MNALDVSRIRRVTFFSPRSGKTLVFHSHSPGI
jgi:hypothetical protein